MVTTAGAPSLQSARPAPAEDAELARVLESCLADFETGRPLDPHKLIAEHPGIAERLRACLTTLDLVQEAAAGLGDVEPRDHRVLGARRLGDFDILREAGRGGMAVVYEAWQISLGRRVALKVLPFAATLDPRQLQRFLTEAQAAAILHHAHIVPVYSVGCERGVHYYAMQFIEGQTLAAAIEGLRVKEEESKRRLRGFSQKGEETTAADSARLGAICVSSLAPTAPIAALPTERSADSPAYFQTMARWGVQAAEALEHAHQLGVIHRDIKPANLLVDAMSNVWITDFGLARLRTHASLTLTGDAVGTLRYMSPEQASARRGLVDHRTDIYSLGATLYEALTLQPAYSGEDRDEVLRGIAHADPPPPRRINPAVPLDLDTVVQKAMAREPEQRYSTAQELADDLRRYLEHLPVRAARPTVRERLTKWAWRHKPVLAAAALVAGLAAAGLLVLAVMLWQEHAETKAALSQVRIKEEEARRNGARAEANFRKALDGLNDLLWELENPRWSRKPGFLEVRHELTRRSMEIFQEFAAEPGAEPAVRFQAARVFEVMVNLHLMERQLAEADHAHAKAVALLEGLAAECPENTEYALVLARTHAGMGNWNVSLKRHDEAKVEYRRAIDACRGALPHDRDGRLHNLLAFLLCDALETQLRDPIAALALAMHAVTLAPESRDFWITRGLAHYRVGEWAEARTALAKAMELAAGGDAREWLLLALTAWRQGEPREACAWYDRAATWLDKHPLTDTLYHFRREAADVMSIRWP